MYKKPDDPINTNYKLSFTNPIFTKCPIIKHYCQFCNLINTTTTTMKSASKQYLHHFLLKPHKPPPITTAHLRRLTTTPEPSSQPPPPSPEYQLTQSIITQLKTTDDWPTNLRHQILSLPHDSLINISKQFNTSSKALQFLQFIHDNNTPSSLHTSQSVSISISQSLLSSLFQTVIHLATHEESHKHMPISDLYSLSKKLNILLTPRSAVMLIKYFFYVKKVQDSVLVYNGLDQDVKTVEVKNVFLNVLLKCDRFDNAYQLLDEMLQPGEKFSVNEATLNIVFAVLVRRDMDEKSEKLVGLIPKFVDFGVFPSTIMLTQLITKLCRCCRNDKAWDLLHGLMKFGKVETASYNALLSGLGRERNYKRIKLLLKEMQENGVKLNVVTFGMLVNHLCKSYRVDDALDMFKKMKEGEGTDGVPIKPDVILYNTLIDGLCKVGRQEDGLVLMKQMKSEDDCVPNVITFNCLIDGFCKSGEIERAQQLFDQMSDEGVDPNVITMNTLVDGMCRHGRTGNAMEFFRKIQEEKGIKGNVVTYSTLIYAFCNANNIERAMRLFEEMESVGSPDARAYYGLISGLTLAGRPDDANSIATKMKKAGFQMDLLCYNTLIGGYCRKKKLDKAVEVLTDMEETGVKADSVTYNTLISYFSQNGDFDSAHKFLKQMIADGNAPTAVTYGTLIHAYCLVGNLDNALNIYEEMLKKSKVPPNTVIYNVLIDSLCKRGRVEHALSLMDEMLQKSVRPNTTTYNAMLKGLSSKNRLRDAFRLMDQMTGQACNPDFVTIEILNEWLSAVGEFEKLREFVQGYQVSSAASSA